MNEVYYISGPRSDFESATVRTSGCFRIPSFACPSCGVPDASIDVWYASLQPTTPEALDLVAQSMPRTVPTPAEYTKIRDKVRNAFRTNVLLPPGSIVGVRPIEVPGKTYIGGLKAKQLREGIDFINAGTNLIVSSRVYELITRCGVRLPLNSVTFRTEDAEYSGYHVLELDPHSTWTEVEHAKYELTICPVCGQAVSESVRGTFGKKQLQGAIFRRG